MPRYLTPSLALSTLTYHAGVATGQSEGTKGPGPVTDGQALRVVFANALSVPFSKLTWEAAAAAATAADVAANPCAEELWKGVSCTMMTAPVGGDADGDVPQEGGGGGGGGEQEAQLRVTSLSLRDAQIEGSLDFKGFAALGADMVLQRMFMSGNKFSGLLDILGTLPPFLEIFTVGSNQFTGPVSLLWLPPRMLRLEIQDNQLSGPLDLTDLPKLLRELRMDNNLFTGTLDLRHLPLTLEAFSAEGNHFDRIQFPQTLPSALSWLTVEPAKEVAVVGCFVTSMDVSALLADPSATTDIPPQDAQELALCDQKAGASTDTDKDKGGNDGEGEGEEDEDEDDSLLNSMKNWHIHLIVALVFVVAFCCVLVYHVKARPETGNTTTFQPPSAAWEELQVDLDSADTSQAESPEVLVKYCEAEEEKVDDSHFI